MHRKVNTKSGAKSLSSIRANRAFRNGALNPINVCRAFFVELPSQHDYNVKMLIISHFLVDVKQSTKEMFFLFLKLDMVLRPRPHLSGYFGNGFSPSVLAFGPNVKRRFSKVVFRVN